MRAGRRFRPSGWRPPHDRLHTEGDTALAEDTQGGTPRSPRRRGGTARSARAPGRSPLRVLLPTLLVVAVVTGAVFVLVRESGKLELDDDLCPTAPEGITASATLLVDVRKPLDDTQASLPAAVLRQITLEMPRNSELRVFAVTDDPAAPRQRLGRACKGYDNSDLHVPTAKDQRSAARDCDDLPAQIPSDLRELASRFCARRDALGRGVAHAAMSMPMDAVVEGAPLVEAIDDALLGLGDRPPPRVLYVLSDMMQHADWYSHLQLDWTDWQVDDFVTRYRERYAFRVEPPPDVAVEVFYVPRRDGTERLRPRHAHQGFWRSILADASVAFRDQPAMASYEATTLMAIVPEADVIARERADAERLLAEANEQQAALEELQQRQAAEIEDRRSRVEREEDTLRERAERLRREEERLQREADRLQAEERRREEAVRQAAEAARAADRAVAAQPEAAGAQRRQEVGGEGADVPAEGAGGRQAPEVAETPAAVAAAPAAPQRSCAVRLSTVGTPEARYPGNRQFNFGNATVLVRYTVDATGATVDEEVSVDRAASTASRPAYLDLFGNTARRVVEQWQFEFAETSGCARRQTRTTTFQFVYE